MARKKYKVGVESETHAISLVTSPAIESDFVALSAQEDQMRQVCLEKDERHIIAGPVLIPDKDIYRNNGDEEYYISFTKEAIEKMEYSYMKEYRQKNITLQHQEDASEICLVETWIKEDGTYDKSVALGLSEDIPVGTWFAVMSVNNIDTWKRIKDGELQGFSVEALLDVEEFSKAEHKPKADESFWTKLKNIFKEAFEESQAPETPPSTPAQGEDNPSEAQEGPSEAPQSTNEPKVDEVPAEPEKTPQEPSNEAENAPQSQENETASTIHDDANKALQEIVDNMRSEIEALKQRNSELEAKVADMGKKPSTAPVKPNAASAPDTFTDFREQLRRYYEG